MYTLKPRSACLFHPFTRAVINFANFRGRLLAFDTRAVEGRSRRQLRRDYYLLLSHTHLPYLCASLHLLLFSAVHFQVPKDEVIVEGRPKTERMWGIIFWRKQTRSLLLLDFNVSVCWQLKEAAQPPNHRSTCLKMKHYAVGIYNI